MSGSFRGLPSVNELLNSPALKGILDKVGDVNVTAQRSGTHGASTHGSTGSRQ